MFVIVNPAALFETLTVCENRDAVNETLAWYEEAKFPGPFIVFAPGEKLSDAIFEEASQVVDNILFLSRNANRVIS